jgi:hypothetical protein
MTTKKLTTEQMVRRCFTQSWMFAMGIESVPSEINHLARAARRFVAMERRQKNEISWDKFRKDCRNKEGEVRFIKFPKNWGKLK